jgi:hypothetical protein
MRPYLEAGDIVLTRGSGFLSRAIRVFSRSFGERRTEVNHVGIITRGGPLWLAELTEALWRVRTHLLWKRYGKKEQHRVAVVRARNVSRGVRQQIARYAQETYQGKLYGVIKIALHAADRLIGGKFLFRRLAVAKRFPICSFLVADAYQEFGFDFGVRTREAQPDDIWDYVVNRPDKYEVIIPLGKLE